MLKNILRFLFGDKKKKDVQRLMPFVKEINTIAAEYQKLSDEDLQSKTQEFRRMLHVPTRTATREGMFMACEHAEMLLRRHPDIDEAVFVPMRRDQHGGGLAAFAILRPGVKPSEDLAAQARGGMTRFGAAYAPSKVVFVDALPLVGDKKRTFDYHTIQRVAEELELGEWTAESWDDLAGRLKAEEPACTLEDLLPEAFAAVKEACRRMSGKSWQAGGNEVPWNMVPFDVQLLGGVALTQRAVAEMGTGEGKTLTAIMPLYYFGLMGKGSHLITVNDYLSKRDAEWNGPIFNFLGMAVGCIDKSEPHTIDRRMQYLSDVTYGTNNEFGFDYLRDNMSTDGAQLVQRDLFFVIVDEVDSILIDEARTPLIISGPVDRETREYDRILPQIRELVNKQNYLVNRIVREAEELLEKDAESYDAGIRALQIYKGAPKHTRYMKLRQEPNVQRLQDKVEMDFIRDKRVVELESELFFVVDEKHRSVDLTEKGRVALSPENPQMFVLVDIVDEFAKIEQMSITKEEKDVLKAAKMVEHDKRAEELHAISQLLHAFSLKQKDVDYVVEENKVVIVDEFTGRKLAGRRWSDGLHQAVEAKEGVAIEKEHQTLATVTIQNYFRMYTHIAGMTGTAETEAAEFMHTYKLDVIVVPPNKPTRREDVDDVIFRTRNEKYKAVLDELERLNGFGLPILVGTTSVAVSETLSRLLRSRKLEHEVLNAKNHAREAHIVLNAGQKGAITIATNMAGRGTDIKLGPGVPEYVETDGERWPGGLQIIGTERHEARRIDRQLRGRSGRQGDTGSSRFFLSLEDDLIMWFGGDRLQRLMSWLGMKEGEAITHRRVTGAIERAQKKVEAINHERRKRLLDFDNVLNEQRHVIYGLRHDVLLEGDLRDVMIGLFYDALLNEFEANWGNPKNMGDADIKGFLDWVQKIIATEDLSPLGARNWDNHEELVAAAMEHVERAYDLKVQMLTPQVARQLLRMVSLRTIDMNWIDHLLAIDDLREGVFLRSYGQRDPLVEYTRDATILFKELMLDIHRQVFDRFFRAQVQTEPEVPISRPSKIVYAKPEAIEATRAVAMEAEAAAGQAPQAGGVMGGGGGAPSQDGGGDDSMPSNAPDERDRSSERSSDRSSRQMERPKGRPRVGAMPYRREAPKVGRNDPCPCGSGKKYKDCCGRPSLRSSSDKTRQGLTPEEPPTQ